MVLWRFDFHLLDSGILWESRDGTIKIKGKWAAKYTLLVPVFNELLYYKIEIFEKVVNRCLISFSDRCAGTAEKSVIDNDIIATSFS
uniref:PH domain-containing protein n=1 Tax=Heterorhabditis bacteriophora TaxID=37862 RepID=A0A1I7X300_HETBA